MLASLPWQTIIGTFLVVLQIFFALWVILRVMLTRHPSGSAFAWIMLALALPYAGFVLYVMFGERPIGRWRAYRLKKMLEYWETLTQERPEHHEALPASMRHRELVVLAERLGDMPMSEGSHLELLETDAALARILSDVTAARSSIAMEFYIWGEGGRADGIAQALIAAAGRGVNVRVLLDDVGSYHFLKSPLAQQMRAGGVHLLTALPVHFLSPNHGRADLRLHRKTIVIDDVIAYTGSMNMADPRCFNQNENVGEWIDAMVRVTGPAVADLRLIFDFDWALQPDDEGHTGDVVPLPAPGPTGKARVVTVSSGPTTVSDANMRVILEAINCARREILITTPYFVPSDALVIALQNAAIRGVTVRICMPAKNDHLFVQLASRRFFEGLLDAGVHIELFRGGLLHTKAITIDGEFALFGTVNMDNRSLHLNFELMLLIYDTPFVESLLALQHRYRLQSDPVIASTWRQRSFIERLGEGACHLISPLL